MHCHNLHTPLHVAKKEMRKFVQSKLNSLSKEEITTQGNYLVDKLLNSDAYQRSKFVSVYINMDRELSTKPIFQDLFKSGSSKVCFVPKITSEGKLKMLKIYSIADYESLPLVHFAKFSLIEPTLEYDGFPREEATELDLVVVPGVAFDEKGGRLGHGKGYYDKYLNQFKQQIPLQRERDELPSPSSSPTKESNWTQSFSNSKKHFPHTIGLGFLQQKVSTVPMGESDYWIDEIYFFPESSANSNIPLDPPINSTEQSSSSPSLSSSLLSKLIHEK